MIIVMSFTLPDTQHNSAFSPIHYDEALQVWRSRYLDEVLPTTVKRKMWTQMSAKVNFERLLQRGLRGVDIPSALEPWSLFKLGDKRPDGVTLTPWTRNRPVVWDFTCVHRLAVSHGRLASAACASVATHRETLKCGKYEEIVTKNNLTFYPISCETLGGFGPQSVDFIRQLSDRAVKKKRQMIRRKRSHIQICEINRCNNCAKKGIQPGAADFQQRLSMCNDCKRLRGMVTLKFATMTPTIGNKKEGDCASQRSSPSARRKC